MKWMTSSLQSKMLAVTGSGTGLLLVAVAVGFWLLWDSVASYHHLIQVPVANERAVQSLEIRLNRQIITWKDLLLRTDDKKALTSHWAAFTKETVAIDKDAKALLGQVDNDNALKSLKRFPAAYQKMVETFRNGMKEFDANYFSPKAGDQVVRGAESAPTELLEQAREALVSDAQTSAADNAQRARQGLMSSIGMVVVVLALAFVITFALIRRNIIAPAQRLEKDLERIAGGDFSQPVVQTTNDELGHVAASAQRLQEELGKLIREISGSAAQLASAAEQTLTITEQTAGSVDQQQSQTQQVATAIDEMASTAQEVARNTTEAAEAARNAEGQTNNGLEVVGAAVSSIDHLANEVRKTVEIINRVSSDSDSIGTVLEVIRGISEQTNLLALNAAIEAARAGEQGRGFSVVADEVRSLAQRTQQSTQEIQDMIERLHGGVEQAVDAMTVGQEQAQASLEHGAKAKEALAAIEDAVRTINNMNTQIASATEEQTAVAEEINRHITDIKNGADQNAEGTHEISQASQSLAELATRLQSLMMRFKTA
jgi:methyl-accepting chemotaxis protein